MFNEKCLDSHMRCLIIDIEITKGRKFIFPLTIHEIQDNITYDEIQDMKISDMNGGEYN
jgi:hypothetical protein